MFNVFRRLSKLVRNLRRIVSDCLSLFANIGRRRLALAAENLFLRKQLALFRERENKALPTTRKVKKLELTETGVILKLPNSEANLTLKTDLLLS
ncbi:MAG TPA: hypothetical protein VHZ55_26785 [Bryobacteraceae bacterium]|jgi:hypothetical protein|nr:hypothetical protein [Bryobacteraceae bacterium]